MVPLPSSPDVLQSGCEHLLPELYLPPPADSDTQVTRVDLVPPSFESGVELSRFERRIAPLVFSNADATGVSAVIASPSVMLLRAAVERQAQLAAQQRPPPSQAPALSARSAQMPPAPVCLPVPISRSPTKTPIAIKAWLAAIAAGFVFGGVGNVAVGLARHYNLRHIRSEAPNAIQVWGAGHLQSARGKSDEGRPVLQGPRESIRVQPRRSPPRDHRPN